MERSEWLKMVRLQTESLYDHIAPLYWETFGFYPNTTHRRFIDKLLGRLRPHGYILDAACGAGRYDGMLLNAGHSVVGIDQSSRMLARAREHFPLEKFPQLSYLKISLQEMDFRAQFDAAICIDAMEHMFPEDWPRIVGRFQKALKPGGLLYVTVEQAERREVKESYERAITMGLPVVYGEMADKIDVAYKKVATLDWHEITGDLAGPAAYHYYPSPEQVSTWFEQAGMVIEEEGVGNGYAHFLAEKE
jgi:2-polyprenyl-3-methyl-5-hydroxy-6-metoxy-1,4-benzoquinol methylase